MPESAGPAGAGRTAVRLLSRTMVARPVRPIEELEILRRSLAMASSGQPISLSRDEAVAVLEHVQQLERRVCHLERRVDALPGLLAARLDTLTARLEQLRTVVSDAGGRLQAAQRGGARGRSAGRG